MIIAHLPAGYVVAKLLHKRFVPADVAWKPFLLACLVGSIAPDFDFLYYLIDSRIHHHAFPPHFPILWVGLLAGSVVWFRLAQDKRRAALAVVFALCGFLHLCLDSFAGSIRWLAPFAYDPYSLFTVPRITGSRRLDYLRHWTSWLELIPIAWATVLWRRAG